MNEETPKLYHREIGFSQEVEQWLTRVEVSYRLEWPRHAMQECVKDKYGPIMRPPMSIAFRPESIFEVEWTPVHFEGVRRIPGRVSKFVVRLPYDGTCDIILSLVPWDWENLATVKTVWLNRRDDKHSTLRKELYSKP
jgi:hypothetical protein